MGILHGPELSSLHIASRHLNGHGMKHRLNDAGGNLQLVHIFRCQGANPESTEVLSDLRGEKHRLKVGTLFRSKHFVRHRRHF